MVFDGYKLLSFFCEILQKHTQVGVFGYSLFQYNEVIYTRHPPIGSLYIFSKSGDEKKMEALTKIALS